MRQVVPGLVSALPDDAVRAAYDSKAFLYDAIVGRWIYHRIFWGTAPRSFTSLGRKALDAAGEGCFAEVGCGSLLFTAGLHREVRKKTTLLADRSVQMLRKGMKRLSRAGTAMPAGVVLLHADASALPVRSGVFDSVLSLNLLHVPCDVDAISAEFGRILTPGRGRLFVSVLVRCGRWSDGYMSLLHRAAELNPPLGVDEMCARVAGRWGRLVSAKCEGNMCFLEVRHAG